MIARIIATKSYSKISRAKITCSRNTSKITKFPKVIALSEDGVDPFEQLDNLPAGGMFIFRHYHASNRAMLAKRLLAVARASRKQLRVLIAGDMRLAYHLAADGVHYPEWQLQRQGRVWRPKPDWQISAAAHSWSSLRRAALAGVDFALLSPVFDAGKKTASAQFLPPSSRPILGICRLADSVRMAQKIGLPVYALGGITQPQIARRLGASGVAGWAGVRAFALNAISD